MSITTGAMLETYTVGHDESQNGSQSEIHGSTSTAHISFSTEDLHMAHDRTKNTKFLIYVLAAAKTLWRQ